MLGPRSSRFHQAALQSGLIDEAGLAACWELIPPERRTPDAIDRRLARQAITTGRLTLWQAQQLLAGRVSGYQIDKYVLLNLLGRGGMGRVFLARDNRLNRMVALKLLSQERMNNPRAIARFRREAKVGAQLQHEHLVRVYDEGESGGLLYLVMEHIDGKNVGQLLGELGRIPWPTAARLARQVASGLEHARLKGLIHRDVNPCNILVTQDGDAKLTDLGLAIDLNEQDNVTREGATVGTFDYVSPEQAKNSRSVDTRSDLYSLGCTLFHMIAGRVPFPVASLPEKLYAHQLHEPEPLTALVPEVPEGLSEVVRRLLRKQPDERFQTPAELVVALEPFATGAAAAGLGGAVGAAAGEAVRSGSGDGAAGGGSSTGLAAITPGSGDPALAGGAGESFFPLDLGPAGPLAGPPRKPARARSGSTTAAPDGTPAPPRGRVRLAAMIGFGAVVAAGAVATLASFAASRNGNPANTRPGTGPASGGGTTAGGGSRPLVAGDVVVRFADGTSEALPDLRAAIGRAGRGRAEVILAAGTTARLGNEAMTHAPDGDLTIRGADGPPATIEVAMKGSQPALLSRANLRLAHLDVVVRVEGEVDAPAIQAERDLNVEHCTFRTANPGARLILAEGKRLTIRGALFVGSERPVELAAGAGASATVDQSAFIGPGPADEPPTAGRALTVRSAFGGGTGVKLKVTASSCRAGAFLVVDQFIPETPLDVEVAGTAIWAGALVQLEGAGAMAAAGEKADEGPPASPFTWHGRGNRFALPDGAPWARPAGATTADGLPVGLAAWAAGGREVDSQAGPIRFRQAPPAGPTGRPADYALLGGPGDDAPPVGADPARVGPGAPDR